MRRELRFRFQLIQKFARVLLARRARLRDARTAAARAMPRHARASRQLRDDLDALHFALDLAVEIGRSADCCTAGWVADTVSRSCGGG